MSFNLLIISEAVLIPLALVITYFDVRYRRIPNVLVLLVLVSGLSANVVLSGWEGLVSSLAGCALGLSLMFSLKLCGGLGAGDVKLFGAICSVIGVDLVLPTFLLIVLIGGVLAVFFMVRSGTTRQTMVRVWNSFSILIPGIASHPNRPGSTNPQTIPYGIAITLGSVISVAGALVH